MISKLYAFWHQKLMCSAEEIHNQFTFAKILPVFWTVFFFWGGGGPMPPHVLVDFVVLPSGHGRSVTDFWGWDAYEVQLRCLHDVSGDIGGCSVRRALKPKFYQPTQTMVTAGILPFRENSHGSARNRTWDLMISSQRLGPLDHEAGHILNCSMVHFIWNYFVTFCYFEDIWIFFLGHKVSYVPYCNNIL